MPSFNSDSPSIMVESCFDVPRNKMITHDINTSLPRTYNDKIICLFD